MRLDSYAQRVESALQRSPVVVTYTLETVQLSLTTGYIRGEVIFMDGSRLAFFEFLRFHESALKREKYRYHFMDREHRLIFRYDDAPHYPEIPTHPHHKHTPKGVVESKAPDLVEVIREAEIHSLGL